MSDDEYDFGGDGDEEEGEEEEEEDDEDGMLTNTFIFMMLHFITSSITPLICFNKYITILILFNHNRGLCFR